MEAPFNATGIKACCVDTPPHPILQVLPSLFAIMCYYRQVRNVYTRSASRRVSFVDCNAHLPLRCGHGVTLPDQEIRCNLVNCKFSTTHPGHCRPPTCTKNCWQYRQYPQQYSPNIDGYCPQCRR
ncbi:hypothetical protein EV421DRAFT_716983 [Armillaria borealis]|uniref:Uncharacterized protein n=1 Tax=Armillaria borealis TaxID=47425 RepID=A0AA39K3F7_9AGAR|nr:hypothetical protein EV421DRAFT_716983 [Armillaria borealis]